jgi:hypothetical protein
MNRMTNRLIRLELESYVHDLVVWGGPVFLLSVLMLFSFMGTVVMAPSENDSDREFGVLLLSVGLSSVLLAVKVSGRNAVEKRTRLFSQLPVSTREVSLASWCVRLLWISIPTLSLTVFLAGAADMPFERVALVTLATYLGATTLVGAISVAKSVRWAKSFYIGCGIVAFVVWIIGNMLVLPTLGGSGSLFTGMGLPGLTGCLVVSGVGFVVIDVWLRERVDDYLE